MLLVNQVLLAYLEESFHGLPPGLGDAAGILAGGDGVIDRLVVQQFDQALHVILPGIQLVQCGGQFDAQFRGVEGVAVNQNNVDAFAFLAGMDTGVRGEGHGHEAHAGDVSCVQILRQLDCL